MRLTTVRRGFVKNSGRKVNKHACSCSCVHHRVTDNSARAAMLCAAPCCVILTISPSSCHCHTRARKEAVEGAEVALQESLAVLKGELADLKVWCVGLGWLGRVLLSVVGWLIVGLCANHHCRVLECHGFRSGSCCVSVHISMYVLESLNLVCDDTYLRLPQINTTTNIHYHQQSQLSSLQDAHASQLSSQQEASSRQLAQQLKTADAIIKE